MLRRVYILSGIIFIFSVVAANGHLNSSLKNVPVNMPDYTLGYVKDIFFRHDMTDVKAALKVWGDEIIKERYSGNDFSLHTKIYENLKDLETAIKQDNVAIVSLSAYDYLNNGSRIGLEPVFAPVINGTIGVEYCLVVRKESNFKTLKDLKGKTLGIVSTPICLAGQLWLDIILDREHLPLRAKHFSKVIESEDESQLILSLFFGKLDACLVPINPYKIMKELNPQVASKTISLMTSPVYLSGLMCYTKAANNQALRKAFYDNTLNLHKLPKGKQLYTLIRIESLVPFKNEYLNTFRDLLRDYNSMQKKK